MEQAKDKATSIKKNVDKLISDVDAFNNMENKALGKAKALITSVKFYQDTCVRLSLDGIQFLEDNVGASEDTLNQLYEELFRFITEAEVEQKRAEQRDRMEASEIMKTSTNIRLSQPRGSHDWLTFMTGLFVSDPQVTGQPGRHAARHQQQSVVRELDKLPQCLFSVGTA